MRPTGASPVHLAVICPRCGSRYQVDPNLRGKNMRCPNAVCRAVFEVREEGAAPPAPPVAPKVEAPAAPRSGNVSGTVGEIVPILQAEAVTETPVQAPPLPAFSPPPQVASGIH